MTDKNGYSIEFRCPYFKITKEVVMLPDGNKVTYFTHVSNNPFVAIIAIDKEKVLVQHQFRPSIKAWNWEFPMGAMDKEELALDAAKRELLEETGFIADNWLEMGFFYVGLGHTSNRGFVFLAQGLKDTKKQKLDESEIINPELFKVTDFENMIKDGTINDGPTLASWQIYKQKIVARAYDSYLPVSKK